MSAEEQWTKAYQENSDISWPAEGVIRILKGTFPNQKMPRPQEGQTILDVGCGDGRHFPLFMQLGLISQGSEITNEIASQTVDNLFELYGIAPNIVVGTCSELPWMNSTFDYLLAWNSCYYMSAGTGKFEDHVSEMARVLKPDGWLICSIPTRDCFIFDNCHRADVGYVMIDSEYFGLRSGEVMRQFYSRQEIEDEFSPHFTNFSRATIDMDWFGLRYAWHVFTAQKRRP